MIISIVLSYRTEARRIANNYQNRLIMA
jgi:hypothetical protein